MSTPSKVQRRNVNAPFKSPLRLSSTHTNKQDAVGITLTEKKNTVKRLHDSDRTDVGKPDHAVVDYDTEIRKYVAELMLNRSRPIDLDEELSIWRSRMHAYNEAKDACLVLFGQLAHIKGCLVKELYEQHDLELDD